MISPAILTAWIFLRDSWEIDGRVREMWAYAPEYSIRRYTIDASGPSPKGAAWSDDYPDGNIVQGTIL